MHPDEPETRALNESCDAQILALEVALDRSEAGSAAKNAFLSSMSHELHTPLTAILGFAQLLRRDVREPLSEHQLQRVDQILRAGEHVVQLLDDILDLSRIESNALSVSPEAVDIRGVVHDVAEMLEEAARRAGIRVIVAAIVDAAPVVSVDRARFTQVLLNLGSNAVKYNRHGGSVTFTVSRPNAQCLRVTVTDTGLGIPVEEQPKLFRPFQRAGQEFGAIPGTGLGLALARRLAELMNASIGFSSVLEQGSEFWIDAKAHVSERPAAELDFAERAPDGDGRAKAERRSGIGALAEPGLRTMKNEAKLALALLLDSYDA